ncbi:hypothetical protein CC86DRAFT_462933 [Ophiobolus disseminans]|uniref:Uncharacterized protein n=1 Tax=Ophiobolus disseminans TaxID=1469910 RepID=A0A6A7AHY9_9PLEO|nr:hypothetical protein CC86DRAFT_462933 [Ophiobolus disseminans]
MKVLLTLVPFASAVPWLARDIIPSTTTAAAAVPMHARDPPVPVTTIIISEDTCFVSLRLKERIPRPSLPELTISAPELGFMPPGTARWSDGQLTQATQTLDIQQKVIFQNLKHSGDTLSIQARFSPGTEWQEESLELTYTGTNGKPAALVWSDRDQKKGGVECTRSEWIGIGSFRRRKTECKFPCPLG